MSPSIIRPEIPDNRPVDPSRFPAEMRSLDQWLGWQTTLIASSGRRNSPLKKTKVPIDVKRGSARADVTKREHHNPFAAVLEVSNRYGYGIGFAFTADDPYVGIDLDKCVDPETGVIESWALAIVEACGSYTEITPSLTGLHIIGRGQVPGDRRRAGRIEIYDAERFFTMTGNVLAGYDQITGVQSALDTLYAETFPQPTPTAPLRRSTTAMSLDDQDVLELAYASKHGTKIRDLMAGDWQSYEDSQSEADLSLCNYLRFWTGGNRDQVDRIFRTSGLYRPKWERASYRDTYVLDVAFKSGDVYRGPAPRRAAPAPAEAAPVALQAAPVESVDSGDSAATACVVELARIAQLEQLLAAERERAVKAEQELATAQEIIATQRARLSMYATEKTVRRNPHLKAERDTVVELAHTIAGLQIAEQRNARIEGREPSREVKLPAYRTIAERIGCSESKVARDVKKLGEWGTLEKRCETVWKPDRTAPDGTPLAAGYVTETYVALPAEPDAWLDSMKAFEPDRFDPEIGRERTHGGNRTYCKKHPHASITITETCTECGDIVRQTTRPSAVENPHADRETHLASPHSTPSVAEGIGQQDASAVIERRQAMRDVQSVVHHAIPDADAKTLGDLDRQIMDTIYAACDARQPLDEGGIARALNLPTRDVRGTLRHLSATGALKCHDDGVYMPSARSVSAPAYGGAD